MATSKKPKYGEIVLKKKHAAFIESFFNDSKDLYTTIKEIDDEGFIKRTQVPRESMVKALEIPAVKRVISQKLKEDIEYLSKKRNQRMEKLTEEEVIQGFRDMYTKCLQVNDRSNAMRALENLAKYLGMFVEKKEIKVTQVKNASELDQEIARLTKILEENAPGSRVIN